MCLCVCVQHTLFDDTKRDLYDVYNAVAVNFPKPYFQLSGMSSLSCGRPRPRWKMVSFWSTFFSPIQTQKHTHSRERQHSFGFAVKFLMMEKDKIKQQNPGKRACSTVRNCRKGLKIVSYFRVKGTSAPLGAVHRCVLLDRGLLGLTNGTRKSVPNTMK